MFSLTTIPDFENQADRNSDNVYSFEVEATSTTGFTVVQQIDLAVTDAVEVVEFVTTEFILEENTRRLLELDAVTSDGSALLYSIVGGDDVAEFQFSQDSTTFGLLVRPDFEAAADFSGDNVYEFAVRAQSVTGADFTQVIRVAVENVLETVIANDDTATVDEGSTVQVDVVANDIVDSFDQIDSVELVEVTNGTAVLNSAGQIEFVHDGSETTTAEVTYRIANQEGSSDTATVVFAVSPVDDLAITGDDSFVLEFAVPTSLTTAELIANDFDSDSNLNDFELQIVDGPSQGTVVVSNGSVVFTPFVGFEGTDTFSYQLVSSDGLVRSDVAAVSATIESPAIGNIPADNVEPENEVEESDGDDANGDESNGDENLADGVGLNRSMDKLEEESNSDGRTQSISPVDFGSSQQGVSEAADSDLEDSQGLLSLEFNSSVYEYFGRAQFLDLAKLEHAESQIGEFVDSYGHFTSQLSLSQFSGSAAGADSDSKPSLSWDVGDFVFNNSVGWMTALTGFTVLTGFTLTTSQIHRVLDVGLLLDGEESIEDIVSS